MTLAPGSSRFDALMDQCSELREVGKVIRLKGWGNQGLDQDDSWAFSVVTILNYNMRESDTIRRIQGNGPCAYTQRYAG